MHSLPLFHRIAETRVVLVGDGAMAEAKRRLIERAGGVSCSEAEAHHARFGFVALKDADEAEAAALRLKRRGLLVNVADRPELCDFTMPSVLDRDPVLVAVGTGGASAGLAKHLRLRLEAILPSSLGKLAKALFEARAALRSRFPEAEERRRALDEALREGGALDPFDPASADRIALWREGEPRAAPALETIEIFLSSDDPDDLTLRQARALGMADRVFHAPDIPRAILARVRADALRIESGDQPERADNAATGLTIVLRRGDKPAGRFT